MQGSVSEAMDQIAAETVRMEDNFRHLADGVRQDQSDLRRQVEGAPAQARNHSLRSEITHMDVTLLTWMHNHSLRSESTHMDVTLLTWMQNDSFSLIQSQ
jgi:hypothetical protein